MPKSRSKRNTSAKGKVEEPDVADVDGNDEDYFYDEIDKFHSEKEKILLEEDSDDEDDYRSEEEEVLGVVSDEDDSDDDEDNEKDDVLDREVSAQAWGRKKSSFYGADAIENLEGSDREEAEREEEEEVLAIQKRLALQIDEDDFSLDMLQTVKQTDEASSEMKSVVEADFSSLSKKAQWKLVKRQSPELHGLIDDFNEIVEELENELCPLMQIIRRGVIPQGYGSDLISLKYRVYLAYIMNISYYLMLKCNKTAVQNHPVITRLVQYKTVINRLSPLSKKIQPELDRLLKDFPKNVDFSQADGDKNSVFDDHGNLKLEFCNQDQKTTLKRGIKRKIITDTEPDQNASSKSETGQGLANPEFSKSMNEKLLEEENDSKSQDMTNHEEDDERRAINYEIAKNRGLKQKRRKGDRNPRVKMREKFRKAKIRRRGQVREYRPELKKYSGEASGIRVAVKKSITLQ